jgi:hypothetical protein
MPKDSKKGSKPNRVTSKDQIGKGAAKKATETVERVKATREARLNDIMKQMRQAQTTDSFQ